MQNEPSDLGEHCSGSSSGPSLVHRAIVAGNMRRSRLVHTPSAQTVSSAQSSKYDYEPSPLLPFQGVSGLSACKKQNNLLSRPKTAGWAGQMPSIGKSALEKALYDQTSPDQGVAEIPLFHLYEPSPLLPFQFQRELQESVRKSPAGSYETSPWLAFAAEIRSAAGQLPSPVASPCISHEPLKAEHEDPLILAEACILADHMENEAAAEGELFDESDMSGDEAHDDGDDFEGDDFEERCEPCFVEAECSTSTGGSSFTARSRKISEEARAAKHSLDVDSSFQNSKCKCAHAKVLGSDSCIDQFNKVQLRQVHEETYGAGIPMSAAAVLHHIHELYFNAMHLPESKQPRAQVINSRGHVFAKGTLLLLGKHVCAHSFRSMVGGSRSAHRLRSGMAMRGIGPASTNSTRLAQLELRIAEQLDGRHSDRSAWACCWWSTELELHDFLPNENAIQFKGPFWNTVYKECYTPAAVAQSGYDPLAYKSWKLQMLPGACQLAASFTDSVNADKIRVKRSARHSNFPECTNCQRLRAAYLTVMSAPGSSLFARNLALIEFKEHLGIWQGDRKEALSLKDHCVGLSKRWMYQCDDKCGSQWCKMPVAKDGRDNRAANVPLRIGQTSKLSLSTLVALA